LGVSESQRTSQKEVHFAMEIGSKDSRRTALVPARPDPEDAIIVTAKSDSEGKLIKTGCSGERRFRTVRFEKLDWRQI
jgi:hypothetical protein